MGQSFSQQTLKVNAKMAVSLLALMRSKKNNSLQNQKREIVTLLAAGKMPNAEIKVESLIHEENLVIASEILELHCEKIAARSAQIESQAKCPEDIFVSIATVVYCSTRLPIPEFKGIATQMALKYTKAWVMPLSERKQYVDEKVLALIDVMPPDRALVAARLATLAADAGLELPPAQGEGKKVPAEVEEMSAARQQSLERALNDLDVVVALPAEEAAPDQGAAPSPDGEAAVAALPELPTPPEDQHDLDELMQRFNALKR